MSDILNSILSGMNTLGQRAGVLPQNQSGGFSTGGPGAPNAAVNPVDTSAGAASAAVNPAAAQSGRGQAWQPGEPLPLIVGGGPGAGGQRRGGAPVAGPDPSVAAAVSPSNPSNILQQIVNATKAGGSSGLGSAADLSMLGL